MASRPAGASPIRAVLFDAVGTLLELREPVGETYARAAEAHGLHISARRIGDAFQEIVAGAPPMVFPALPLVEVAAREREWRACSIVIWLRVKYRLAHTSSICSKFQGDTKYAPSKTA